MPTYPEQKPPWQAVPAPVRQLTIETLRASIVRATRAYGSYSPSPTFRLLLADGRRAFFKGNDGVSNPFARDALAREEHLYRYLHSFITPWAPKLLGAFVHDTWRVLLLEDLGPQTIRKWTSASTAAAAHAYADFHTSTIGRKFPPELPPATNVYVDSWAQVLESQSRVKVATLAGSEESDALKWLDGTADRLLFAERMMLRAAPRWWSLLHLDTRADNLRVQDGRLRLFDWNFAAAGPPELDVAYFAQAVAVEGGPDPDRFVQWYRERGPLDDEMMNGGIVRVAALLATHAWQPELPTLPRLRTFQKVQLAECLKWLSQRIGLPYPAWAERLR